MVENMASELKHLWFPVTPFDQNCSLVWCEKSAKGVIIDPGAYSTKLEAEIVERKLMIEAICLTHGHWDHAAAGKYYADKYGVKIIGPHVEDTFLLESLPTQAARFGLASDTEAYLPDIWLNEGDILKLGEFSFEVLHCPGHTPGHVVFIEKNQRKAWVGDVIFNGSIGRTDFPRGNLEDLIFSIKTKLLPLGDDIEFYPGHGSASNFGRERKYNPFLQ